MSKKERAPLPGEDAGPRAFWCRIAYTSFDLDVGDSVLIDPDAHVAHGDLCLAAFYEGTEMAYPLIGVYHAAQPATDGCSAREAYVSSPACAVGPFRLIGRVVSKCHIPPDFPATNLAVMHNAPPELRIPDPEAYREYERNRAADFPA